MFQLSLTGQGTHNTEADDYERAKSARKIVSRVCAFVVVVVLLLRH